MNKDYVLVIFSEDKVGLLNQITTVFTSQNVNIDMLSVTSSTTPGVHKYSISVNTDEEKIKKLSKLIEKKVDVLKVSVYTSDEVVHQEIALYKVARNKSVENLVREQHVRILEVEDDYLVLEKTGHKTETLGLYELLKPYGVYDFVRSGLIAVSRTDKEQSIDFLL